MGVSIDEATAEILLQAAGTHERWLNRLAARSTGARTEQITAALTRLHEARSTLDEILGARAPAVTTPREIVAIREFFLSETISDFANEHQTGTAPWAATIDASGQLVVRSGDGHDYYMVRPGGRGFEAVHFVDAMDMVDPETPCSADPSRGEGLLLSEDGFDTPAEAFSAILSEAFGDSPAGPTR